jgi:hypothetical protein
MGSGYAPATVVDGLGCSTPGTELGTMACSPARIPAASGATKVGFVSSPDRLRLAVCRPYRAADAESVTDMTKYVPDFCGPLDPQAVLAVWVGSRVVLAPSLATAVAWAAAFMLRE